MYGGANRPTPKVHPKADHQARSAIDDLNARFEHLTLVCHAMWDIIQEHTDLNEDMLIERMQDLDIADGKMDGAIQVAIRKCKKCDKRLPNRIQVCQYCNTYNPYASAFDGAR